MDHDPGRDWQGGGLDLDAYLARIGFEGERTPTIAALRALHRGHVTTFPFENLEIILGRPVVLDMGHLQDKFLRGRRGGYCFEHVKLFAAVLERLGFSFRALIGRVTMGADKLRPATHAILLVTTDDDGERARWVCDVGFGGGPLEPLPFVDGTEVFQDGWGFRLEQLTNAAEGLPGVQEWGLSQRDPGGWLQRHNFVVAPSYPLDFEVLSHFVSTHAHSPFTTRPYTQRFTGDRHHQLDGTTLTTTTPDGQRTQREVAPEELPDVLRDTFDIVLDPDDTGRLVSRAPAVQGAGAG